MRISWLLGFATLIFVAQAGAQTPRPEINEALVKKLEALLRLPPGAATLNAYARYYVHGEIAGRRMVRGVYASSPTIKEYMKVKSVPVPNTPGAFLVKSEDELPSISDGGCSVLEVSFDLASQSLVEWRWQGEPTSTVVPNARCHGRG